MKKRQRKKNAKKAIKRMQAIIAIIQAEAILSQLYMNHRIYKSGGVVPRGESVCVNESDSEHITDLSGIKTPANITVTINEDHNDPV